MVVKVKARTALLYMLASFAITIVLTSTGCTRIPNEKAVRENFDRLYMPIMEESLDVSPYLPKDLSVLDSKRIDPINFLCPGSGTKPGPWKNVNDWMDFIYIGNQMANVGGGAALLISPPENHEGKGGIVLFKNHDIRSLDAKTTIKLIENPWIFVTNEEPSTLNSFRTQAVVRIPARFQKSYAGSGLK